MDLQVVDLLGNGTACLVWSSPLLGDSRRPMRYVNLMGDEKPHLLVKSINNLGAETRLRYAPSTKFYLLDKLAGRPWITRLPFAVHVVERVETYDHISRNRFVTTYAYHHGHFDGEEREFRGFAMVEQTDTEVFGAFRPDGTPPVTNDDAASHMPPVLTRTWFHTGAYLGRDRISRFFAGSPDGTERGEYYREPELAPEDALALLLDDTILPGDLTPDEERQAARSLKGMMLRQEAYALDGVGVEPGYPFGHPYTVTEQNCTVRLLQHAPPLGSAGDHPEPPRGREGHAKAAHRHHAVFFTHPREALTFHYERNPNDPRVQHALTVAVDEFGNVLKAAAIGYGRRRNSPDPEFTDQDRAKQRLIHITANENTYTNAVDDAGGNYRTPLAAESATYELRKPEQERSRDGLTEPYRFEDVRARVVQAGDGSHDIAYEDIDFEAAIQAGEPEMDETFRRLIEHVRTLYRRDDLTGLGERGELEPLALSGDSYMLALTPGLLRKVFKRKREGQPDEELLPPATALDQLMEGRGADAGGYVAMDGAWWIPSGQVFYSAEAVDAAAELAEAREHFFLPRRFVDPFDQVAKVDYDAATAGNAPGYDLLVTRTEDALGNVARAENGYRVLGPRLLTDPNGNRAAVALDALGLVTGTAIMGKRAPGPIEGDSLEGFVADLDQAQIDAFFAAPRQPHPNGTESEATEVVHELLASATSRILYDLDRFRRTQQAHHGEPDKWLPASAATIARETHVSDLAAGTRSKLQVSFTYSDGFDREIQSKVLAEPGPTPQRGADGRIIVGLDGQPVMTATDSNPRWVSSGWTIFNNKGAPVRQYEPFFTDTHQFEFGVEAGVSPVLFYDPVERVVVTLHPDHTWQKVVFDPWQHTTYDVNDTVAFDPRSDPDVADFLARLTDEEYLPTWREQRIGLPQSDPERVAAEKATVHADTPTAAHFDALSRPFLTLAANRFERKNGNNLEAVEEKHATRVDLDSEGNQRQVIDARDRVVMRYDYDMLGNQIRQASMEAGERWTLNDIAGKPIRAWDSRGCLWRFTYDELRRPAETFVTDNSVERLDARTVYGEGRGPANNHRLRVFQVFDGAGVVTNQAYDFKGNLLRSQRALLPDYKQVVDWQQNPDPNDGTFTSSMTYDALNRPTAITTPDNSIYHPAYNEANLLDAVAVNLRGAASPTPFVTNINYDAKGQRELIAYGNGAQTRYEHDPLTFRLKRMRTTRPAGLNGLASQLFADPTVVQDLHYTYDPMGNITHIEDAALQTIFHSNEHVQPICAYTYDAIYRLIEAEGREHIGQTAFDFDPPDGNRRDFPFAGLRAHPNEAQAMRSYTEAYAYDAAGNLQFIRHTADGGGWTRGYEYDAASLIEAAKRSNRLTRTTVGDFVETYTYTDAEGNDADGCMTAINAMTMVWDSQDRLQQVDLGGGGTAYYVYDAAGQRARKVIERQNGGRKEERIYLGGFEIYRAFNGNGNTVKLVRETMHIMDGTQRIALVETRADAPVPEQLIRYQFGNHLGSASLELDDTGQIISYEEYRSYGSASYQAGHSAAEVSLKRYRYTGMERDEESGLEYHSARYYMPWLARWVSPDPSGIIDGPNLFPYVNAKPIIASDPSGREEEGAWRQLWLMEQKGTQIEPIATRADRGISTLQRAALHVLAAWFGPGNGAHWSHPSDKPFVTQRAKTSVPLTASPGPDNMKAQADSKAIAKEAAASGRFTRVWDPVGEHSIDQTVPPRTIIKQPLPEAHVVALAPYAKDLNNLPKSEDYFPPRAKPVSVVKPASTQLELPFGHRVQKSTDPSAPRAGSGSITGPLLTGFNVVSTGLDVGAEFARGENAIAVAKAATAALSLKASTPWGVLVAITWGALEQSKRPEIRGAGHAAGDYVRERTGAPEFIGSRLLGAGVAAGVTTNLAVAGAIVETAKAGFRTSLVGMAIHYFF